RPVPVTLLQTAPDPRAANAAPASLTLPNPAVAVIVPVPQVPAKPFGVAITKPAGSESVNATPASADEEFGLFTVKFSEVEPFNATVAAPNIFEITGGEATVRFAAAG